MDAEGTEGVERTVGETADRREDLGLLRKQRAIKRMEGHRGNTG
jgi:hypothetical protein